jgi:hypothetical protein
MATQEQTGNNVANALDGNVGEQEVADTHVKTLLYEVCSRGDADTVLTLMKEHDILMDTQTALLHAAAKAGHVGVLVELLEEDIVARNKVDAEVSSISAKDIAPPHTASRSELKMKRIRF